MVAEVINFKDKKKERAVKWSVVLFAHEDIAQYSQCVAHLVEAIGPRAEIILVATQQLQVDILRQYAQNHSFAWREVLLNEPLQESTAPLIFGLVRGEFACLLQDSVLVSKHFLTKMTYAFEHFPQEYNVGPIGSVIPIMNIAPARQQLPLPVSFNPADVDMVQKRIEEQITQRPSETQWKVTGSCSNACVMIHRTAFEKAGYPNLTSMDTTSRGSEWALRSLSHGFLTIMSGNTYVYQAPGTVVADSPRIPMNAAPPTVEKLGICYRIKIATEKQLQYFLRSVIKSAQIADKIFVLDEGSKVKVSAAMREHEGLKDLKLADIRYEKVFQPFDDRRSYNTLLEWAEADGMTWVLMLETCEILEPKCTRAYFEKLMHPINPFVLGYADTEYYFWDSEEQWRADNLWSRTSSMRLAKVIPGRRIGGFDSLAARNGYVPLLPVENIRVANFGIHCFDLIDAEHRQLQYEQCLHIDQKSDWSHILNETTLALYPFTPDNTLSVYTPINQGGDKLVSWLDHVWSWADEIVVGNDRSQLNELNIACLEAWGAKVVPCNMGVNYAEGRNAIVKQCTQNHILQLDIDERMDDPLILARLLQAGHDAWIFPIDNLQRNGKPAVITETARLFRNKDDVSYWGFLHETIDDFLINKHWNVAVSPGKIIHFGYQWLDDASAYNKMQRYVGHNILQIRNHPDDGRALYNLSLHLLEDGLLDDALRMLTLSVVMTQGRVLPMAELAKCHLQKAYRLFNAIANNQRPGISVLPAKEYSTALVKALQPVIPVQQIIAKGHCVGYFDTHPDDRLWLSQYLIDEETKLFSPVKPADLGTKEDILHG